MVLLLPDQIFQNVTYITPEFLRERDIRALLLDVDNTLAHHNHPDPLEGVVPWLRRMQAAGFHLLILSNAPKRRVRGLADSLGLEFISAAMKPLPFGYRRARKRLGLPASQIAMVGDQIFTDIAGANLQRMRTILVLPAQEEGKLAFRARRRLEKGVILRYNEREKARENGGAGA